MIRRTALKAALLMAVALVACDGDDKDPPPDDNLAGARVVFDLEERNDSGLRAVADLTFDGEETTTIVIRIVEGPAEDATQGGIQAGADCEEVSAVADFPLNEAVDGVSQTELEVSMLDLQEGDFLITLTDPEAELPALACSRIPKPRS